MKTTRLACLPALLLLCASAAAQRQYVAEPLEPKTQLEALQLKVGAVVLRGTQRVGAVRGQGQGQGQAQIEVDALEVIDTGTGQKARGVALTVEEAGSQGERGREITAFVDYEELDGLTKGFEAITRFDRSETQLPSLEASYRTRGDLVISVFSTRGGLVRCVVSAGEFAPARVVIMSEGIESLRSLLNAARNRLDEARAR